MPSVSAGQERYSQPPLTPNKPKLRINEWLWPDRIPREQGESERRLIQLPLLLHFRGTFSIKGDVILRQYPIDKHVDRRALSISSAGAAAQRDGVDKM